MRFQLEEATDKKHKYVGVFTDDENKELRVPFGAAGYEDYTTHRDPIRRTSYLTRHRVTENWNNPYSPGALSRWLLWETKSIQANVQQFKRRFKLV